MVYIMMSKTEEKFVNFVTHKCFLLKNQEIAFPTGLV